MIQLYDAIKKMRMLTDIGVPFSFEYYSYNETKKTQGGLKVVQKAQLRIGLRADQSKKAEVLIGYYDYDKNENRWFYLPLLIKFNGLNVIVK